MKPEDADKFFDSGTLIKLITSLGKQSRDEVTTMLFGHYNQFFSKVSFMSLNLEKILGEVEKQKNMIDMLHESYARKVWKSFLEKIVILYFQTFIMSCSKISKDEVLIIFFHLNWSNYHSAKKWLQNSRTTSNFCWASSMDFCSQIPWRQPWSRFQIWCRSSMKLLSLRFSRPAKIYEASSDQLSTKKPW